MQGKPVANSKAPEPSLWTSFTTALCVLSSLGILMVAMRNTITLHLESFWGASGSFWQQRWDYLLNITGGDQFKLLFVGMYGLTYLTYWGFASIFLLLDFTNLPSFIRPYKTQPGTNEPLDAKKFLKVMAVVNFNQLVMGAFTTWFTYHMMVWRGYDSSPTLPTFHWVLGEIALYVLLEEFGFYYGHRILHHKSLYKHIHKIHHEWQAPIAPTAIYCHPVEFIFGNVMPGLLGPALTGCHFSTLILWINIQIIFSMIQHSGYHLPFMPSPEAHDYHHLKFNQCFGVLGILDLLHGTDDRYRDSKHFLRDFVSFSFTPVREIVPDDDCSEN